MDCSIPPASLSSKATKPCKLSAHFIHVVKRPPLLDSGRTREVKGAGGYLLHTHFNEVLNELKLLKVHESIHA